MNRMVSLDLHRAYGFASRFIPRTVLVHNCSPSRRQIALTFDDGPDSLTDSYLDVLEDLGVQATFFLVGRRCRVRPDAAWKILERGHQVAAHGYTHRRFTTLSRAELLHELTATWEALPVSATRTLVRPPYGALSAGALSVCALAGHTVAMWSFDTKDYEIEDPDALAARSAPNAMSPGDILLLHEGQPWTLRALPKIVENLRRADYELVTVGQLMEQD